MVIDSHTLIWWLEGNELLSYHAREILQNGPSLESPLRVSAVTFWEMRMKEHRGQLHPQTPVSEWPALLAEVPWIEVVATGPDIWLLAAALDWAHRYPADRIIAATAQIHGVPVLTKDEMFHRGDCPVKAVW